LKAFLDQVNAGWIDDLHVLKARAVRFLAISDQDNGDTPGHGTSMSFRSTYPRPWCGYYDAGAKRLYPWGGYDHALNPKSAFGLEGSDGALVGCVNPSDRYATDNGTNLKVFSQGAERPLINGEWMDYFLKFNPDGSVEEGMPASSGPYSQVGNFFITRWCATNSPAANIGDMSIGPSLPITSFEPITGYWSITLAPDIDRDCGGDWPLPTYASAFDAIQANSPMYRVQVSPLGRVQVVKVRPAPPPGTTVTMDSTNWLSAPGTYYQDALPSNSNGSLRITAHPVDTFLLPGLPQQHWMTSP
jgi:hypothetical protein